MDRYLIEEHLVNINSYLENFVTDNRKSLIDKVLSARTRYITVVLEDIYQSQNASAVIRTADCFGVQDVHVIENYNRFEINRDVVRGASQWVTVRKYNQEEQNTQHALALLKENGYRIVATSPYKGGGALHGFDLLKGKAAIIFGSEHLGISQMAEQMADEFLFIPMVGFTESLNVSVSAALVMNFLMSQLRRSTINWQLTSTEHDQLKYEWLMHSLKKPDLLVRKFFEERGMGCV
ncbi:MAG: RNA methyltransferase [Breznakibacter sp.]